MKKYILPLLLLVMSSGLHAQHNILNDPQVNIKKLDLDATNSDLGPAIINGELYFSSLNKDEKRGGKNNRFFNLFSLPLNEAETKNRKQVPQEALISPYHDGPVSYCYKTQELFVTRSDTVHIKNLRKKYIRLGIVIYQLKDNNWIFKEEFPFNNSEYSIGHPAINSTGDTLIFVSDQEGGYGKTDLYFSIRKDSIWQKPHNLGKRINTKRREMTPFINQDGKLFFASDGYKGKGKLDLYWSEKQSGQYIEPRNLRFPFNTKADDFGLTIHPNQKIGYFTSNRKKKKNDNIYRVKTANYNLHVLSPDSVKLQISNISRQINDNLNNYVNEKKKTAFIPDNVHCSVDFEVIENDKLPGLKITYGYNLSTDTLKLGLNTYQIGQYLPERSNAVVILLEVMKNDIEGKLSNYFIQNKRIHISISNTSDVFPSNESATYSGEFGEMIKENFIHDKKFRTYRIVTQDKINAEELTFLRAYGIKNYMLSDIVPLTQTRNTFSYEIIMGDQIEKKQKWVKIEFTIQNAFGNF